MSKLKMVLDITINRKVIEMNTEKFSKWEIKNIVTEALIDINLDKFLKKEFNYDGNNRENYYDFVDEISTSVANNHFAE